MRFVVPTFRHSVRGYRARAVAEWLCALEAGFEAERRRASERVRVACARAQHLASNIGSALEDGAMDADADALAVPPAAVERTARTSLPVAIGGLRRGDVDAFVTYLVAEREREIRHLDEEAGQWQELAKTLREARATVRLWRLAELLPEATGVLRSAFAPTLAPLEAGEASAPKARMTGPLGEPQRAFERGLVDARAASVRAIAGHIVAPDGDAAGWLMHVLGRSALRVEVPAPGLRAVARNGTPVGRVVAIHLIGFPPEPVAVELAERDGSGAALAVRAEDVASVHSDRLRLRQDARVRPLASIAGALAASGRAGEAAPLERPVVILVGPTDSYASVEEIIDRIDDAPGLRVDFRLFRDGVYRVDGRTPDTVALAALLQRLPGVRAVTIEGETLHVTLAEGAA